MNTEREIREEVLRRAGGFCEDCHQPASWETDYHLVIHHIKPRGMGGSRHLYQPDELVAICAQCHNARHGLS